MKILKEVKDKNILTYEIEEGQDKVIAAMDFAFKDLAKQTNLPGFRQGKIPRKIFEQQFGTEIIREKAINKIMNDIYPQLVEEKDLFPIDYPTDIKIITNDEQKPLVFSISIPVKPEIKLGKYKGIKITKVENTINDQDVDNELSVIRERYSMFEPVTDKPASSDHMVTYDIKASVDGQELASYTKPSSGTKIGAAVISTEFDNQLTGMALNETKTFNVEFAPDHRDQDIAGKKVDFIVTMKEIREKKLPELDAEFVKKIADKDNVADFRKELTEVMQKQKKISSENQMKEQLLHALIEDVDTEIPEVMVQKEIDNMMGRLNHSLKGSGLNLESYIKLSGKSMDSIRNDYKDNAVKKVKIDLALEGVAKTEKLEVTEEDLDKEIAKLAEADKVPVEEARKRISKEFIAYVKTYLIYDKTIDYLMENAKIK